MKPIAAPIVGGVVTSTIHVLILVPVFFAIMKERALRNGTLTARTVVRVEIRNRSQSDAISYVSAPRRDLSWL